jgi:dTDP-4-amino-4,6-dideoxygalactose transaminase
MTNEPVAFSKPDIDEAATDYLLQSLHSGLISGDGPFTQRCHDWLRTRLRAPSMLTHSCTGALEMAALLARVGPGDEVLMPSYTFVSTANAFVLRGATPVFVDIRPDTLNLDERLLDAALTVRTRAVGPVHYAGVSCDMDAILSFARSRELTVIEDAAQGYGAFHRDRPLGTLGAMGCLSFHVSKNIVSGEGGALIVNDPRLLERANIVREKGTNRTAFLDRKVDKYEWLDVGSSYLPSDILAALLLAQFEQADRITARRLDIWSRYHAALAPAEAAGLLRRPVVPDYARHNAHIYYVLLADRQAADRFRAHLNENGIGALTHYVPLHSAPAGLRYGRAADSLTVTARTAETLVRISLYSGMTDVFVDRVIAVMLDAIAQLS